MEAVVGIKKDKIAPYAMEFLDAKTVEIGKQSLQLDWNVKGNMLIVSVSGPPEAAERYLNLLEKNMKNAGAKIHHQKYLNR